MNNKKEIILYNQEVKERFLTEEYYNPNSRMLYRRILARCYILEDFYEKDVYDFTYKQRRELCDSFNVTTMNSIKSSISVVNRYVAWAVKNGYAPTTQFGIEKLLTVDDMKEHLSKNALKNMYIKNREELESICDKVLVNAQDAVVVVLLYEGLYSKEQEDMINLRKSEFDYEQRTLQVGDRIVKVSEHSAKIIQNAIEEDTYYKSNGLAVAAKAPILNLNNNEYIIRGTYRKNSESNPVTRSLINLRVTNIGSYIGKRSITPYSIFFSGLANKLREFEEINGELTNEDFERVCREFGSATEYLFNLRSKYKSFLEICLICK